MTRPSRWVTALLVIAIAMVAIALRFWGLSSGLADDLFVFDEVMWVNRAKKFLPLTWASFDHNFKDGGHYPALYGYATGLTAALANALGLMPRGLTFTTGTILLARGVSAAAGVVNVALVGLLASRMYSASVGIAAAALAAVTMMDVVQVSFATVDVLLLACFTLALLASWSLATRGTPARAALAGFAAGLAFATKYTGLAALAPAAMAVLEWWWRERSARRAVILGSIVLGGFAIGVLLACPPCVLRAETMLAAMRRIGSYATLMASFGTFRIARSIGWYGRPYLYQLVVALPYGLGVPLFLLALGGVALALWRRELADRILLAGLVPYFLVMAGSGMRPLRYLLPLLPSLLILAARAVFAFSRWRRPALAAFVGVWLYSLAFTVSVGGGLSYDHQRQVARWIADRGAPARVAFPRNNYLDLAPFLRRAGLTPVPVESGRWFAVPADAFVLPTWTEVTTRLYSPRSATAADLAQLVSGTTPYRKAARWTTWYLQRDLFAWLDPMLGAQGFTVYLRDRPPAAGRQPPGPASGLRAAPTRMRLAQMVRTCSTTSEAPRCSRRLADR